jgi:hypothetical protein
MTVMGLGRMLESEGTSRLLFGWALNVSIPLRRTRRRAIDR